MTPRVEDQESIDMNRRAFRRLLAGVIARCLFGAIALNGFSSCSVRPTNQVEHGNVTFDISPDGQQVVFASASGDLYLFHLETSRVSQLTRTPGKEKAPTFSPDGKSITYAADTKGRKGSCLFVSALDGKQLRQLTNDPVTNDSMPSYSPDGSHIVFARAHRHRRYSMGGWTWDDWDLYVMKSDGSEPRRITRQKYYGVSSPKFLPGGSNIVYSADADRTQSDLTSTILTVASSGEQPPKSHSQHYSSRRQGGTWASEPDVSTDGSIAFVSDRMAPYHYDLFIMNRDGTTVNPLGVTKVSRYNQYPNFLPDGRSLLFLAGREWNANSRPIFSLWKIDTDGKDPRCIAESMLFTDPLRWKPNQ